MGAQVPRRPSSPCASPSTALLAARRRRRGAARSPRRCPRCARRADASDRGGRIVDARGREVLLRGMNVRRARRRRGVAARDAAGDVRAARATGWSVVRLQLAWSRIEPRAGRVRRRVPRSRRRGRRALPPRRDLRDPRRAPGRCGAFWARRRRPAAHGVTRDAVRGDARRTVARRPRARADGVGRLRRPRPSGRVHRRRAAPSSAGSTPRPSRPSAPRRVGGRRRRRLIFVQPASARRAPPRVGGDPGIVTRRISSDADPRGVPGGARRRDGARRAAGLVGELARRPARAGTSAPPGPAGHLRRRRRRLDGGSRRAARARSTRPTSRAAPRRALHGQRYSIESAPRRGARAAGARAAHRAPLIVFYPGGEHSGAASRASRPRAAARGRACRPTGGWSSASTRGRWTLAEARPARLR